MCTALGWGGGPPRVHCLGVTLDQNPSSEELRGREDPPREPCPAPLPAPRAPGWLLCGPGLRLLRPLLLRQEHVSGGSLLRF